MKGRIRSGEHEANVNEQERTVYSENEVQWANGGTRGVLGGAKREDEASSHDDALRCRFIVELIERGCFLQRAREKETVCEDLGGLNDNRIVSIGMTMWCGGLPVIASQQSENGSQRRSENGNQLMETFYRNARICQ